jgi:ubiquinone biosynthesis monooxygenase Coq7
MVAPGHPLDRLLGAADRALRALFAPAHASRPLPEGASPRAGATAASAAAVAGASLPDPRQALSDSERRTSAALMRVNHAGEIAAQGLYHGQALAACSEPTRQLLLEAAREESDHLAWCETRLTELQSRPSRLDPLWYLGSFAIGALAALTGDRTSLGFVAETERQVERHLDEHLQRLPAGDTRSRAILQAMREDEIAHGTRARSSGGVDLPAPIRSLMRHTARVMTRTAYFI